MFSPLIIFVLLAVGYGWVECACPHGWILHGKSCYHFSHDTEEWIGALAVCRELGGQLVEIEDAAEDNFIISEARRRQNSYWIGLSDIQEEGTWVWMNSKIPLVPGDYTNWESGQPDNDDDDENCVNLEENFNMLWNDLACHTVQNYICERLAQNLDIVG
ncbi:perlucin-like protein [Ruditapes philippinarum]|uniref:perlucin-like protein n=1 Tax=Ruditapes philippinarum TaxID=129788 RepID=UPI00295B6BF9|nr:perlucin-like protein [Ruditapes philippinarum]